MIIRLFTKLPLALSSSCLGPTPPSKSINILLKVPAHIILFDGWQREDRDVCGGVTKGMNLSEFGVFQPS